ncbi:MAG: DUF3800 domain-containing protein [Candidatus Bipolaricaulota bacterium]
MRGYRLYVDEVGNSSLRVGDPNNENDRFLSLTGVAVRGDYALASFVPEMDALKRRFFQTDPDVPVILHRTDMLNRKWPFTELQDPATESAFYVALNERLAAWEYAVVSVVIDKHRQKNLYQVWQANPYHYCMKVLLERYVMFLQGGSATGDVMVESRQAKDDFKLKESYKRLYISGTERIAATSFQRRLSSKELKVKPKSANIAGLQLADLLACGAQRGILSEVGLPSRSNHGFDSDVWALLEGAKFIRDRDGKTLGFGKKLLP